MRSSYIIAITALLAGGPAMGQVIIQTPNPDAARHEQRATQDRADAQWEHQQAQRRAAVGDYQGAAEAQRDAHRDWRDSHRQQDRAQDESGAVVIGR
ncbi:MAG TPA: hypothetical protein VGI78_02120 [Acetobacteraceae bacterium]|jgi:hypothetical protein